MRWLAHLCLSTALAGAGTSCATAASDTNGAPPTEQKDAGDAASDAMAKLHLEAGGSDVGPSAIGCSGDLRSVITGNGSVITTCPPDQGCYNATCIPACDAAAKAKGSFGCDFYAATPVVWLANPEEITPQSCYTVSVTNPWVAPLIIDVEYDGQSYDVTKFGRIPNGATDPLLWPAVPATGLPPGQVAILFLSEDPSPTQAEYVTHVLCPFAPAINASTSLHSPSGPVSGVMPAFHITTNLPATAYDIYPFGGAVSYAPGATMLLPSSAWGTNYLGVGIYQQPLAFENGSGDGVVNSQYPDGANNYLQVIALQDTTITIAPTADMSGGSGVVADFSDQSDAGASAESEGGTVAADPAYFPVTYTLKAGQVIQWNEVGDLTGSILASDQPVALIVGNGCFNNNFGACDQAHQQVPPISGFGSEYVGAPLGQPGASGNGHEYLIVAAADNTVVTVDRGPGDDGGVPDGGSIETFTLNSQGQMLYGGCSSAIPFGLTCTGEPNPVVITSQDSAHPIYVGQYLNGCGTNTVDCGDPDFVNVLAPAQFLNRYVFYTDVSYPTTALTIVRKAVDKKFKDVTLDCLGTISGFVPAGSKGEYETAVAVIKKQNLFAGTCKDGLQTATSDGPFGITVWGLANYASYGYPAGGNVSTLNAVYLSPEPK